MPPLTRFQRGAVETGHLHTNDQIIDTETSESWEPGGGEGAGVLEDPGNVWAAETAVAEGHRIAETNGAFVEVFEVEVAGSTDEADGHPTFFPADPNDWQVFWNIPGGKTFDGSVEWRHIGRVGEPPVASVGDERPLTELNGDDGQTLVKPGSVTITTTKPYAGNDVVHPLVIERYADAGVVEEVLRLHHSGDGDLWLRDGGVFAFQQGGNGLIRIDEDKLRVQGTGPLTLLEITKSGDVIMPNLPTTNPAVAGQLWNDGGTLKVSAG